jgi:hypothetical protein
VYVVETGPDCVKTQEERGCAVNFQALRKFANDYKRRE